MDLASIDIVISLKIFIKNIQLDSPKAVLSVKERGKQASAICIAEASLTGELRVLYPRPPRP